MAKPAAAQMNNTLGLTTVSASGRDTRASGGEFRQALHPLRAVVRLLAGQPLIDAEDDQRGADDDPQPRRPPGGLVPIPPARPETSTKMAVNAVRPTSQPIRKARPVGRGRGVCSTSTAGMIDSGDSATTSANGMSSVSTDPQSPDNARPSAAYFDTKPSNRRQGYGQYESIGAVEEFRNRCSHSRPSRPRSRCSHRRSRAPTVAWKRRRVFRCPSSRAVRRRSRPGDAMAESHHRRRRRDGRVDPRPHLQAHRLRRPTDQPRRGGREHETTAVHDEPE